MFNYPYIISMNQYKSSFSLLVLLTILCFMGCVGEKGENDFRTSIELKNDGYVALLGNNLSAWKGQIAEDPREIPELTEGMSETELQQLLSEVNNETFTHWYMQDGMLLYDGTRDIGNIETIEEYADFELVMDWKIGPKGDSGIFLRNMPQVQIWDPHHQGVGSGGLFNNDPNVEPIVTADKPVGEWNRMVIRMISDSVWVQLNGEMVVDGAIQHNYWANYERPAPSEGQIVLQSHGTPLWFKNLYIKKLN